MPDVENSGLTPPDIEDANAARQATGLGRAQNLLSRAASLRSAIEAVTVEVPPQETLDPLPVLALRQALANETAMRDHHERLAQIRADTASIYDERILRITEEISRRLGETLG
jgi:hypothetical protein